MFSACQGAQVPSQALSACSGYILCVQTLKKKKLFIICKCVCAWVQSLSEAGLVGFP